MILWWQNIVKHTGGGVHECIKNHLRIDLKAQFGLKSWPNAASLFPQTNEKQKFLRLLKLIKKPIEEGYIEYGNIENCNIKFEVK